MEVVQQTLTTDRACCISDIGASWESFQVYEREYPACIDTNDRRAPESERGVWAVTPALQSGNCKSNTCVCIDGVETMQQDELTNIPKVVVEYQFDG